MDLKQQLNMVVTDLDGTLFNSGVKVGDEDYDLLIKLGDMNVCRVFATGRSFYSVRKVLPMDFPFDYLVFSSGAGIMEWKNQKILYSDSLSEETTNHIAQVLDENSLDFMIHKPIPDNHHFFYTRSGQENKDLDRRLSLYKEYAKPLSGKYSGAACQLLIILSNNETLFVKTKELVESLKYDTKIIRTTSPLSGDFIWLEIFPGSVSKGNAAAWICRYEGINQQNTLAIGNDYNDIDMLNWAAKSYVVSNAVSELKSMFQVVESNDHSGFSKAVKRNLL